MSRKILLDPKYKNTSCAHATTQFHKDTFRVFGFLVGFPGALPQSRFGKEIDTGCDLGQIGDVRITGPLAGVQIRF
ncbi:MAG TPA: hypothetical protein VHX65_17410 [Pirellulales bacterium]|nr:hypothetical protein [Pirellulales bacterium]